MTKNERQWAGFKASIFLTLMAVISMLGLTTLGCAGGGGGSSVEDLVDKYESALTGGKPWSAYTNLCPPSFDEDERNEIKSNLESRWKDGLPDDLAVIEYIPAITGGGDRAELLMHLDSGNSGIPGHDTALFLVKENGKWWIDCGRHGEGR